MRTLLVDPFTFHLTLSVVALCVMSAFLRKRDPGTAVAAIVCTFICVAWGTFRAWVGDHASIVAFSGEGVDPATRYRELLIVFRRSDVIGHASLVFGICALAATSLCLFAFEWRKLGRLGRSASIVFLVATAVAFVPATAMSRRSETLGRDTIAQAARDVKRASTSEHACFELEFALSMNDRSTLESMLPDTRERAHACVADRLACIDAHDAQCWEIMNAKTEVWNELHPGRHETTLQLFVLESPLLIDEQQKADAARRTEPAESALR